MSEFDSVKAVFNVAQTGSQHEETLFKALEKLAECSTTPEEFLKDFLHNLKYCMIVFQKEPAVERMINFVASYATRQTDSKSEVRQNAPIHLFKIICCICFKILKLITIFTHIYCIFSNIMHHILRIAMMKKMMTLSRTHFCPAS